MSGREVITLNVGGTGVNIGAKVTEQYIADHKIDKTGHTQETDKSFTTFFAEQGSGQLVPRALTVDLEPSVCEALQNSDLGNFFHPDWILSGKEDAGGNYARGHYSLGREMMASVGDKLQKIMDECDNCQGFVVNHSLGGGTGGGLTTQILERLAVDYRKKAKIGFAVRACDYNGFQKPNESYNEMLCLSQLCDLTEVQFLYDNYQVCNMCQKDGNVEQPSYVPVNELLAKAISGVTSAFHFQDASGASMNLGQLTTDLVPFPRLHFMSTGFARIGKPGSDLSGGSTRELCTTAVDLGGRMTGMRAFDPVEDKYMGVTLLSRGITGAELGTVGNWLKEQNKLTFVEWVPSGLKTHEIESPIAKMEGESVEAASKSVTMIGNNTGMNRVVTQSCKKYDVLYAQRAYVHHYVNEGMEEGEFSEARENLGFLEKDYLDVLSEQADDEDDDDEF